MVVQQLHSLHQYSSVLPISREMPQGSIPPQGLKYILERIGRISIHPVHCAVPGRPEHRNDAFCSNLPNSPGQYDSCRNCIISRCKYYFAGRKLSPVIVLACHNDSAHNVSRETSPRISKGAFTHLLQLLPAAQLSCDVLPTVMDVSKLKVLLEMEVANRIVFARESEPDTSFNSLSTYSEDARA